MIIQQLTRNVGKSLDLTFNITVNGKSTNVNLNGKMTVSIEGTTWLYHSDVYRTFHYETEELP